FGSHSFIRLSLLPDASRAFVGCHSSVLTSQPCPVSTRSSAASAKSQILILPSSLPEANLESLGDQVRARTVSVCPWITFRLFMLGCHILMTPRWSPDIRKRPECDQDMARMAASWACRIVSKLKLLPFHRVNSPEAAPVSSRLPSGVHLTTFMGH